MKYIYGFIVLCLGVFSRGYSQCAMCRAVLQSESDNTQAAAINDGIVYLMIIPYVLAVVIGLLVYLAFKKRRNAS